MLLGWRVPSPASQETIEGGLKFLECLCGEMARREMEFFDVKKRLNGGRMSSTSLPLPATPAVAAEYGSMAYFLGHPAQQEIFALMHQAYSVAQLTRNELVIEQSLDLAQWDILSLVHRLLMSNGHRKEPAYLTPEQWGQLGGERIVGEIQRAIESFVVCVSQSYL